MVTDFDPSKTLTARKATFEPYKTPVLISVDPSFCEKSNKNPDKGGVHNNQKYPTLTFLIGEINSTTGSTDSKKLRKRKDLEESPQFVTSVHIELF